ncbi:MAG: hypothetical protein WCO96_05190 [Actinomycetes bacterium]
MSSLTRSGSTNGRDKAYQVGEGLREVRGLAGISVGVWAEGVRAWENHVDGPGIPRYPFAKYPVESLRVTLSSAESGKRGLTDQMLAAALDVLSDALPRKSENPEVRRLGNLLIDQARVTNREDRYRDGADPDLFPFVADKLASAIAWLDELRAQGSILVERVEHQVARYEDLAARAREIDERNIELHSGTEAVIERHIEDAREALARVRANEPATADRVKGDKVGRQ